jgi:hypothetical protein
MLKYFVSSVLLLLALSSVVQAKPTPRVPGYQQAMGLFSWRQWYCQFGSNRQEVTGTLVAESKYRQFLFFAPNQENLCQML